MIPRNMYIYDDYTYLMQYIPADWNLQHSMILPLGPPKKARNISSKYERFAGSRRPVRSRSIYLTTMQIMNITLKKSSKNIKKNKKTNPRCSHLKCEQLLWKKNKKYLKTILICIFWRWVHQVLSFFPNTSLNLILPEEIWTHRPSSTTQPESFHKDSPKNNPSPVEGLEYKFPPQINPSFSIERIHLAFFSHYILLVTFCFHSFFILFFGGRGKSSRSFETSIIYRSKMAMYFPNF